MAAAAIADAVPPSPIHVVAWLARTRLAAAAADATICLYLAGMWLLFGGLAAMEIGQLVCGEDCPEVDAAVKVVVVAGVILVLVLLFGVLPLMAHLAEAAPDIEAAKVPAPRSFAEAMRDVLRDTLMHGVLASSAFALLVAVAALLEGVDPVKGTRREMIGSEIRVVGALGMDAVNCLVIAPIVTVRIWRVWRMMRNLVCDEAA